jgi:hypothetical protein
VSSPSFLRLLCGPLDLDLGAMKVLSMEPVGISMTSISAV